MTPDPSKANDAIARARDIVSLARRVAVLTGAGISAESGVPTFRGPGGLWREFRPEDLANSDAFERDPRLVWEWYDWRRARVAEARPNPGHEALARLEARVEAFTLATQNVDGLHRLAGSRNLIELHGDLWTVRCTRCGAEREERTVPLPQLPPVCRCGGIERPGVVWFGESLPEGAIDRAADAVEQADVMLVVGTSAAVWPAVGLIEVAFGAEVPVIEITLEATAYSDLAISILEPAGVALPLIVG
jgi:NAD-dependent deacetylase